MPFTLRPEHPKDIAAIESVTVAAFAAVAHASHTEHMIVNALRRNGALALSLVAERQGQVIGHMALSPVSISDGSDGWFGLAPLSVAPDYQGQGVGSALAHQAIRWLKAQNAAGCVVLGFPSYYERFGFKADAALVLADVPPQYFLALPFTEKTATGAVTYHASFDVTCL